MCSVPCAALRLQCTETVEKPNDVNFILYICAIDKHRQVYTQQNALIKNRKHSYILAVIYTLLQGVSVLIYRVLIQLYHL
jgi:hypothetical protein